MTTFADRVFETTESVGVGPFALKGRVAANRKTIAEGFGSDATDCVLCIEEASGSGFVIGVFPLTSANVLGAATTIYDSSNDGNSVTFGPGVKNIFSTLPAAIVAQLLTSGGPSTPVPALTVAPTITGTGTVGQTLTASTGTWSGSPTSYAYQWRRNDTAIAGATSATYLLLTADASTSITCAVTASNATGPATAASISNAISVAAVSSGPAPAPGPSAPPAAPPPSGPDTRPGWFAAPANAAVSGTASLISGRTVLTNGVNGGKAGTGVLTTTGSNYAWFAVANSAVPTFTDVASGFAGGFSAAGTFTDSAGQLWYLYQSDYPASYTSASVTLS